MTSKYLKRAGFEHQIVNQPVVSGLNAILVIPAFNEPNLIKTLQSIEDCKAPKHPIEVIVVFNHSVNSSSIIKEKSLAYYKEALEFSQKEDLKFRYLIIKAFDLPQKTAGVGLARKIGMDEAVFRLGKHSDGLIIALDADCIVAPDYLVAIEQHFDQNKNSPGASIHYEHPLIDSNNEIALGIIQYELHLRYYNQLVKYTGHPYAFHTVGSSMVVRSWAYQKQGGMNKRKAGEDFYFLQKIIQLGNFTEIKSTCVYPSPRISDRVPFGTGKAQGDWINNSKKEFLTYHPNAGLILKMLFDLVDENGKGLVTLPVDQLPDQVIMFIGKKQWQIKINEIDKNTSNDQAFIKRFFSWFNLFLVMQFAHFYRDNYEGNIPVSIAAGMLLEILGQQSEIIDAKKLLEEFRRIEKAIG
jgi:glycosyltransferase involved in cell wall biosynthesis